jgi:uncharacterized membrane protein
MNGMETIRTLTLGVAALALGVMAGLFFTFSNTIMPSLGRSEDRTFVEAMQKINVVIVNGRFLVFFVGALIAAGIAAALHLTTGSRRALPWLLIAFALYLAVIIITGTINIPLNNKLNAASLTDASAARDAFETVWNRWNLARTVLSFGAFIAALGGLITHLKQ